MAVDTATQQQALTHLASMESGEVGRVLAEISDGDLHTLHQAIGQQVAVKKTLSTASSCGDSSVGPVSTAPSASPAKRRSGDVAGAITPKPPAAARQEGEGRPAKARVSSAKSKASASTTSTAKQLQTPEERAKQAAAAKRECVPVNSSFESAPCRPGILEMERRFVHLNEVFRRWDSSDHGTESTISVAEFKAVLACYYHTTPEKLTPIPDPVAATLDWKHFQNVIHSLSYTSSPRDFDLLIEFLLQCIGDVSKVQEKLRRTALLGALFVDLAKSKTACIPQALVDALLGRWAESLQADGHADLLVSRVSPAGEGEKPLLDHKDFAALLLHVLYPTNSPQFDDAYYRLKRAAESVLRSERHSAFCRRFEKVLDESLLPDMDQRSPLLMYGTQFDPSTVIEMAAADRKATLMPCILSHKAAEDDALRQLVKYGFQRGHWLYVITDPQYCPENFLRQLGVTLSTNANRGPGMIHKRMRVFVFTKERSITHWPNILTMMSLEANLDAV